MVIVPKKNRAIAGPTVVTAAANNWSSDGEGQLAQGFFGEMNPSKVHKARPNPLQVACTAMHKSMQVGIAVVDGVSSSAEARVGCTGCEARFGAIGGRW